MAKSDDGRSHCLCYPVTVVHHTANRLTMLKFANDFLHLKNRLTVLRLPKYHYFQHSPYSPQIPTAVYADCKRSVFPDFLQINKVADKTKANLPQNTCGHYRQHRNLPLSYLKWKTLFHSHRHRKICKNSQTARI